MFTCAPWSDGILLKGLCQVSMIYAPFSLTHSHLAVYLNLPDVLSSGYLSQSPRTQARLPPHLCYTLWSHTKKAFFKKKKKKNTEKTNGLWGGLFDIY